MLTKFKEEERKKVEEDKNRNEQREHTDGELGQIRFMKSSIFCRFVSFAEKK